MDVSVIMINYNTFDLTKDAIESIFSQTDGIAYEIILVDNLSPDGSGERLRDLFGERIVYLQSGGNLGTSKAFNLGISRATGKYVLWLNTDILLRGNFIGTLFSYMETHPECGICGGNVFDFAGNPAHSFRKVFPCLREERRDKSLLLAVLRKLFRKPFFNQFNYTGRPMAVGYVTGADMMIRSALFSRIDAFDEDIFMYSEEVEFTWRAVHRAGMTVMSVPDAEICHLEGASFGAKKSAFSARRFSSGLHGSLVMYTKCYGKDTAVAYLKILRRAYRKFGLVAALLGMRDKKKMYAEKRAIVEERLAQYAASAADGGGQHNAAQRN